VPHLVWGLYKGGATADWGATEIPLPAADGWCNVFTGERFAGRRRMRASALFREFPVAVLVGETVRPW
jgi:maltooligosyltrehalose synthase